MGTRATLYIPRGVARGWEQDVLDGIKFALQQEKIPEAEIEVKEATGNGISLCIKSDAPLTKLGAEGIALTVTRLLSLCVDKRPVRCAVAGAKNVRGSAEIS